MIAVILLNYNLNYDTFECIDSILQSDYKSFKICLVDNGSEIENYNELYIRYRDNARIQIIRLEKNIGYVGGVNFGMQTAAEDHPEYLLVMNNDTILDISAIRELKNTADRYNGRAIVSGKVYDYVQKDVFQQTGMLFTNHKFLIGTYPGKGEKDTGQLDEEAERDSLDDVFWLLPTRLIEDIGYYSPYFYLYAEQGDYAQRARRKGYKLIYTPRAKIWHKGSMTSGGGDKLSPKIGYWRGKGIFIFQYRNLEKKYFIQSVVINFCKFSARYLASRGKQRESRKAFLRGYFDGFLWLFNKTPNTGYNPYAKN